MLGARLGARPRVRPRRARVAWPACLEDELLDSARRGDRAASLRRSGWAGASSLRARPDPRHALRGAHAARRVRLHRLAVETLEALYGDEPAPPRRARAPRRRRAATSTRALRYARRAGDRALRCSPTRRPRGCTRRRSRALELAAPDERARELLLLARRGRGTRGETRQRRRRPSYRCCRDRAGASACGASSPRAAVAVGGRMDMGPSGTTTSARAAARGGARRRSATRTSSSGPGYSRRLAGALRDEPSRERRDALSREAVELARASGQLPPRSPTRSTAGRPPSSAPDTVAECLALATELARWPSGSGTRSGSCPGTCTARSHSCSAGDMAQAPGRRRDEPHRRRARDSRHSSGRCSSGAGDARARHGGRLAEAEELIGECFALGETREAEIAIPVHRLQLCALRDLRGGLEDARAGDARAGRRPSRRARPSAARSAHLDARLGARGGAGDVRGPDARRLLGIALRPGVAARA